MIATNSHMLFTIGVSSSFCWFHVFSWHCTRFLLTEPRPGVNGPCFAMRACPYSNHALLSSRDHAVCLGESQQKVLSSTARLITGLYTV